MNPLERKLQQALYRHNCPDPLILGEYHLQILDAAERHTVADHLSLCPHCRREVAQLAGFLAATADRPQMAGQHAPTLLGKAKLYLIQLLEPGLEGAQTAGVWRDENNIETQTELRIYNIDNYLISVAFQPAVKGKLVQSLVGNVANMDQVDVQPDQWNLYLWQKNQLQELGYFSAPGSFLLDVPKSGTFEVILIGKETEIHLQYNLSKLET